MSESKDARSARRTLGIVAAVLLSYVLNLGIWYLSRSHVPGDHLASFVLGGAVSAALNVVPIFLRLKPGGRLGLAATVLQCVAWLVPFAVVAFLAGVREAWVQSLLCGVLLLAVVCGLLLLVRMSLKATVARQAVSPRGESLYVECAFVFELPAETGPGRTRLLESLVEHHFVRTGRTEYCLRLPFEGAAGEVRRLTDSLPQFYCGKLASHGDAAPCCARLVHDRKASNVDRIQRLRAVLRDFVRSPALQSGYHIDELSDPSVSRG